MRGTTTRPTYPRGARAVAALATVLVVGTTGVAAAAASDVTDESSLETVGAPEPGATEPLTEADPSPVPAPAPAPEPETDPDPVPAPDPAVETPVAPEPVVAPVPEAPAPTPGPSDEPTPSPVDQTPPPAAPSVAEPVTPAASEELAAAMPTGVTAVYTDGVITFTWTPGGDDIHVGMDGLFDFHTEASTGYCQVGYFLEPGSYTGYVREYFSGERVDVPFTVGPVVTAPEAPGSFVAAQTGPGEATLGWTVPADGGSPITGYEVTVDDGAPSSYGAGATAAVLTGLTGGLHTVQVVALNEEGRGAAALADVEIVSAPSAPQDVTVTAGPVRDAVSLSWSAPSDLGHPELVGYLVVLDGSVVHEVAADTLEVALEALAAGPHQVEVVAFSEMEESQPGTVAFEIEALAVLAPTDVSVVQVGPHRMRVTWVDDSGDERITGYEVVASPSTLGGRQVLGGVTAMAPAPGTVRVEVGADDRSAELDGLLDGTLYRFSVTALTADGAGESGDTVAPTADEWRAPSAVRDATVAQTGPRQITVRFAAPADEGTSAVLRYVVGLSSSESGGYEFFDPDTREVVIDDLDPLRYDLGVLAENSEGSGPRTDLAITVRADWAPPVTDGPTVVDPVTGGPSVGGPALPVVQPVAAPAVQGRPAPSVASPAAGALARTGSEAGTIAAAGMLLVGLGGVLVATTRRKRRVG